LTIRHKAHDRQSPSFDVERYEFDAYRPPLVDLTLDCFPAQASTFTLCSMHHAPSAHFPTFSRLSLPKAAFRLPHSNNSDFDSSELVEGRILFSHFNSF